MKFGIRILAACVGALILSGARARGAQMEPVILHSTVECWPQSEFLMLRAVFQPGLEIVTAKAYFHSNE